jgi:hypothetical protein
MTELNGTERELSRVRNDAGSDEKTCETIGCTCCIAGAACRCAVSRLQPRSTFTGSIVTTHGSVKAS